MDNDDEKHLDAMTEAAALSIESDLQRARLARGAMTLHGLGYLDQLQLSAVLVDLGLGPRGFTFEASVRFALIEDSYALDARVPPNECAAPKAWVGPVTAWCQLILEQAHAEERIIFTNRDGTLGVTYREAAVD